MKTVQFGPRDCENAQRIVVSQICLDRKWDSLEIFEGPDGFRFHVGFVESLSEQGHITI